MEARTKIDLALDHQLSQRRESALAAIARYRTPTGAAIIPIWFALLVALLIACVPSSKVNPIPGRLTTKGAAIEKVQIQDRHTRVHYFLTLGV